MKIDLGLNPPRLCYRDMIHPGVRCFSRYAPFAKNVRLFSDSKYLGNLGMPGAKTGGVRATPLPVMAEDLTQETAARLELEKPIFLLRDYQDECIDACVQSFDRGVRRVAVNLPTGGGKTVVFAHLIDKVKPAAGQGSKTLVLAHRRELIVQAYEKIVSINPGQRVEIEMGRHVANVEDTDIVVASVPTLGKSSTSRLERFDPAQFKLIIIDEFHHAAAKSYLSILEHFGALDKSSKVAVAGFSATLLRADGLALNTAVDKIVYSKGLVEMVREGHLCDIRITTVTTKLDLKGTKIANGDYDISSLADTMNKPFLNELVYRSWARESLSGSKYRSTLIFCVDIRHCAALCKVFRDHGVDAHVVTSETHSKLRTKLVDDFKKRRFPVMINCTIFTEGTDIPNIDMIVINRPTRSQTLYTQMVGRGLRLYHNKSHCHIIDMVGDAKDDKLITVPTLAGLSSNIKNAHSLSELIVNQQAEENARAHIEEEKHNIQFLNKEQDKRLLLINDLTEILSYDHNTLNDHLNEKGQIKVGLTTKEDVLRNLDYHKIVEDRRQKRLSSNSPTGANFFLNWLALSKTSHVLPLGYDRYLELSKRFGTDSTSRLSGASQNAYEQWQVKLYKKPAVPTRPVYGFAHGKKVYSVESDLFTGDKIEADEFAAQYANATALPTLITKFAESRSPPCTPAQERMIKGLVTIAAKTKGEAFTGPKTWIRHLTKRQAFNILFLREVSFPSCLYYLKLYRPNCVAKEIAIQCREL